MDNFDRMYPDVHSRLMPHVHDAINSMSDDQLARMTDADINSLAETAMARSGMLHSPPRGHNRSTVNDIAVALILSGLAGRRRGFFPFFSPFFPVFPFLPFGGGGRDFDRDRDHGFHGGGGGFHGGGGRR